LEVRAAGLAAQRRTETNLIEMRGAMFDPALDELQTMLAAHAAFHSAVASATGNPLFEHFTRPLYHVAYGEDLMVNPPHGYWTRIDADHRELIACLAARDPDAAATVGRRHLDYIAVAGHR
ncbi:MAG: FadR/GntR family transcriptional regulator, partial [Catenulispora sp.]